MQNSKTLFWVVVGLLTLAFLFHAWFSSWVVSFSLALLIYAVVVLSFGVFELKKRALNSIPDNPQIVKAKAEEFSKLDELRFKQMGDSLCLLGFEHVADFTVTSHDGKVEPAFGRLYSHPQQHCFAEVGQVLPASSPSLPVGCVIMSSFGESEERPEGDEQIWTLATTDRPPDAVLWTLRHPRKLVSRHLHSEPQKLFQIHLGHRQQMQEVLGLPVSQNISWETFCLQSTWLNARLRRALERKNPFLMLYEWKFVGPKQWEWWGEYSRRAARRKQTA